MASGDTFRILVATDNHLGYLEKDAIRGEDSFRTFEEIFRIAKASKVDLVLLGGDLFDLNKPSRATLVKASTIFRKYCLGDDPIRFEVVSDQSVNFPDTACVNYEDPNYNIGLPVFSIHGNHDDPTGVGGHSAMDLFSRCNFVNYFGKAQNINDIKMYPILMQKGSTKLALYGLGSVRDERLHRTFESKRVQWIRPLEEKEDFFNIFVIHQNRTRRSQYYKNAISEAMLPEFLDMVIWGHEHECLIDPEESVGKNYYVCQPGSSVATSLSQGETVPKHVGILEIKGDQYRLFKKRLKTVRPFRMKDVILADYNIEQEEVSQYLESEVEELIQSVKEEYGVNGSFTNEMMPLIRLRVDYTGFKKLSPSRFGQKFVGKVANHDDILLQKKRATKKEAVDGDPQEEIDNMLAPQEDGKAPPIHALVNKHLKITSDMSVLSSRTMGQAVQSFVEKMEKDAIADFFIRALEAKKNTLIGNRDIRSKDDIERAILNEAQLQKCEDREEDLKQDIDEKSEQISVDRLDDVNLSDSDDVVKISRPVRKAKKRKKTVTLDEPLEVFEISSSDEDSFEERKTNTRSRKRKGKQKAGGNTKNRKKQGSIRRYMSLSIGD